MKLTEFNPYRSGLLSIGRVWLTMWILVSGPVVFSQSAKSEEGFIPDKTIEKLAVEADQRFFPLFLESFKWLKTTNIHRTYHYYRSLPIVAKPSFYVIKTKSANLKIKPFFSIPKYAVEPYQITFPVAWSDDINPDPSWRLWFHSLTWLRPYLVSNNIDSVSVAYCIIDEWIRSHTRYPVRGEEFAYDDHAVAERALILAEALEKQWKYHIDDRQVVIRIQLSLLNHLFFLCSLQRYTCWHNHAIIYDEKLIETLKLLPQLKMRDEMLRIGFSRVFEQYRFSFSPDGVHKEHSPCYHLGFTGTLNSLIASALELGVEISPAISELQANANQYSKLIHKMGRNFPVGDCSRVATGDQVNQSKNHAKDPSGDISPATAGNPLFEGDIRMTAYEQAGWIFAIDSLQNLRISAQSDFYSFSHYHRDETSLVISARKHELIIDPGLHSYSPGPVYNYYRSAEAHNVLVAEGIEDVPDPKLTGLAGITRYFSHENGGKSVSAVEMTHPHYRKHGMEVYRQLIFPGGHEIVVRDMVKSRKKRIYKQLYHLWPGAKITGDGKNLVVSWEHHPYTLIISGNYQSYQIVEGRQEPLQGWYFPAFNKMEPAPVLELIRKDNHCLFTTRISVRIPGVAEIPLSKSEKSVKYAIETLESYPQRKLQHLPYPRRWKPQRK